MHPSSAALDKRTVTLVKTDFRVTLTFCTVSALEVPIYDVYWLYSPAKDQLCWKHTSEIKSGTVGL